MPPGWDRNPIGTLNLMTMVRKALGLQASVQGHAVPNVNLEVTLDDYTRSEFAFLRGGTLAEWFTSQNPVAGNNACWTLTPAAGTIAVVTEIRLVNFAAIVQQYRWGFTTADAGMTAAFPQQRDQRMRGKVSAIVPSFGVLLGPNLPSGARATVPVNGTLIIPVCYVLTASDATVFKVVNEAVNQIGEVGLTWTERPAGPQEI